MLSFDAVANAWMDSNNYALQLSLVDDMPQTSQSHPGSGPCWYIQRLFDDITSTRWLLPFPPRPIEPSLEPLPPFPFVCEPWLSR